MHGMDNGNGQNDPLEALWRKTGEEIKEVEVKLQRLKERFKKLDDARSLVREAEYGELVVTSEEENEVAATSTLKDATLAYIRDMGNEGQSASDVVRALVERGYGKHVTQRVFYSMIYLTLMRLVESGDVRVKKGPRGRLFAMATKGKGLFQEYAEAH